MPPKKKHLNPFSTLEKLTTIDPNSISPPPVMNDHDLDLALSACFQLATNPIDTAETVSVNVDDQTIDIGLEQKKNLILGCHLSNFCDQGHLAAVKYLIEILQINPVAPLMEEFHQQPPLYSACNAGQAEIVNYLLTLPNMSANYIDRHNGSLFSAVRETDQVTDGHIAVLNILKQKITNPKIINLKKSGDGLSPLHAACAEGQLPFVKIFIDDFGADINSYAVEEPMIKTPFLAACRSTNIELVRYLIESKKIEAKHLAMDKSTAFYIACHTNQLEMARYIATICPAIPIKLLPHGHPLLVACQEKFWDLAAYLLTEHYLLMDRKILTQASRLIALPNVPEYLKNIFSPIAKNNKLDPIRIRLQLGENHFTQPMILPFTQAIKNVKSRAHQCLEQRQQEKIEVLSTLKQKEMARQHNLAAEAQRQAQAVEKAAQEAMHKPKTPEDVLLRLKTAILSGSVGELITAIRYFKEFNALKSQLDCASASSSNGVDINSKDENGDTLLHIACKMPVFNKLSISTLIINGADILSLNYLGETPFFVACKEGSLALVTYFLDHRHNYIDTPNLDGKTPADISLQNVTLDPIRYRLRAIELQIMMQNTARINASAELAIDAAAVPVPVPYESDPADNDWTTIESNFRLLISRMTIHQLRDYFFEETVEGMAKKMKKMRRIELVLLEQRALSLLEHIDSKTEISAFACMLINFLKYEEQIVLSAQLLNLWEQKICDVMHKGVSCLTTLSYFIHVFAIAAKKPSEEFKKEWTKNSNIANENMSPLAITRSIHSCAKLFMLVDPSMTIPEKLIFLVNHPKMKFNPQQLHALGNAHVVHPIFQEQPTHKAPNPPPNTSLLQQDVFNFIDKYLETSDLGYTIFSEKMIEELRTPVDIFIDRGNTLKSLVVQVDGPVHFNYHGDYRSSSLFNTKLLEKLGFEVIRIPYSDWGKLQTAASKTAFIAQLLQSKRALVCPQNLTFFANPHPCDSAAAINLEKDKLSMSVSKS